MENKLIESLRQMNEAVFDHQAMQIIEPIAKDWQFDWDFETPELLMIKGDPDSLDNFIDTANEQLIELDKILVMDDGKEIGNGEYKFYFHLSHPTDEDHAKIEKGMED